MPLKSPVTWLLLGKKPGDNRQVMALAEALEWPFKKLLLRYRNYELITNLLLRRTLLGLNRESLFQIKPPWPDLIITAGRRNEPVARWIQKQSAGRVKIVHLGRPWTHPGHFDLVVASAQYHLISSLPNVVHNILPLTRLPGSNLETPRGSQAAFLANLPSPRYALLIGGRDGSYYLDEALAKILLRTANDMAKRQGGSLLLTTSARSPANIEQIAREVINVPHYGFFWGASAADNPYPVFLNSANEFIVTGDSISMLADACFTGRPVHIFSLSRHPIALPGFTSTKRLFRAVRSRGVFRELFLAWIVPKRMRRDLHFLHQHLVASGCAVWLGQEEGHLHHPLSAAADLERSVLAVKALFSA